MTKTPKWLPDGSGIDPESLNGDTVVETVNGFRRARHAVGPIVRVFADVTPPKPDPRVGHGRGADVGRVGGPR